MKMNRSIAKLVEIMEKIVIESLILVMIYSSTTISVIQHYRIMPEVNSLIIITIFIIIINLLMLSIGKNFMQSRHQYIHFVIIIDTILFMLLIYKLVDIKNGFLFMGDPLWSPFIISYIIYFFINVSIVLIVSQIIDLINKKIKQNRL